MNGRRLGQRENLTSPLPLAISFLQIHVFPDLVFK
jgi:hypothetical protein